MPWRQELKVCDVDAIHRIEVTCLKCARHVSKEQSELIEAGLGDLFISEAQQILKCEIRHCSGRVRLTVLQDVRVTAFEGGMP